MTVPVVAVVFSDRFRQAIAQLGDASCDVRVGAIAALERISRDSRADYEHIVEILVNLPKKMKREGRRL